MTTLRTRRHTTKYIPADTLADRAPFKTSGSLYGTPTDFFSAGRLRGHALRTFWADRDNMDYAVYSYGTPIAWHVKATDTVPAHWASVVDPFSVTTSKHKLALNFPARPGDADPVVPVGFNWSYLTEGQRSALRTLLDAASRDDNPAGHVTPDARRRASFDNLVSKGYARRDLAGRYYLTAAMMERLS